MAAELYIRMLVTQPRKTSWMFRPLLFRASDTWRTGERKFRRAFLSPPILMPKSDRSNARGQRTRSPLAALRTPYRRGRRFLSSLQRQTGLQATPRDSDDLTEVS